VIDNVKYKDTSFGISRSDKRERLIFAAVTKKDRDDWIEKILECGYKLSREFDPKSKLDLSGYRTQNFSQGTFETKSSRIKEKQSSVDLTNYLVLCVQDEERDMISNLGHSPCICLSSVINLVFLMLMGYLRLVILTHVKKLLIRISQLSFIQ
jgi:hypothetical protein